MEESFISRVPRNFFVTSGAAAGTSFLVAFDNALRKAGIADYNLLKVSSILPAGARAVKGVDLVKGSLLPCVYAVAQGGPEGQVTAAVAVAVPAVSDRVGVIMEWSGIAPPSEAVAKVEAMAREAMALRDTPVKEILTAWAQSPQVKDGFACAVAAVALW